MFCRDVAWADDRQGTVSPPARLAKALHLRTQDPPMRMHGSFSGLYLSVGTAALMVLAIQASGHDTPAELELHAGPNTRLLVLAPHPDDETLGAAGLMQRVLLAGGSVRVVMMTSGDAFPEGVETATHVRHPGPRDYRNYGNLRERETIAAMQTLGINRGHILFLGFPDGGLCLIASSYLSDKVRAFESPYTRRVEPPAAGQMDQRAIDRGAHILAKSRARVAPDRPTIVA